MYGVLNFMRNYGEKRNGAESLIDKPDTTLETILNADDLANDFSSYPNQKVVT